jgi:hypothetical protein
MPQRNTSVQARVEWTRGAKGIARGREDRNIKASWTLRRAAAAIDGSRKVAPYHHAE